MRRRLLPALAVALAAIVGEALAHDHYGTWFGADGGPCCSDLGRECRPVRSYFDELEGVFMVLLGGRWVPVPPSAVRPYRSFDGSSHACIGKDGAIYCFVPGDVRAELLFRRAIGGNSS